MMPFVRELARSLASAFVGPLTGTATVVFTDLAGSTALRARLGERAADAFRREHDAALVRAVNEHRGRLVKSAGDGIMAAFDAASDAVLAAQAMQRTVDELGRRRRLVLGLRVGIGTGDVSWEDGDCFGLPVVEAARLEAAATPGQILCADLVRAMARGRSGVEFRLLGDFSLKGLDEPMAACEVLWAPVDAVAPDEHRCVGRDRELDLLGGWWQQATAGSGGVVFVVGEPGVGKTTLLAEFAAGVRAAGGMVWQGAAHEGEGRAYGPVAEFVDGYIRSADPGPLRAELGAGAGLVARVVPSVRAVLPDVPEPMPVPPEVEQDRTVDAVVQFIMTAASSTPLVIVVDDAQWADAATVGLLRTVARRAAQIALLLVIALRHLEAGSGHPLTAVARETRVRRLPLSGLPSESVAALIAELADGEVPPAFVAALTAETNGNPFFVREVVQHLLAEDAVGVDGRWALASLERLDIPEGVREIIDLRVARLSQDANRLLRVAAGFERGFDLTDTAVVAGLDEHTGLDALDEALAAHIVRPGDRFDEYIFTHALFRHTLWAEWSPSRRVRLHRAIAEQLEKRGNHDPTPEQAMAIARHFHLSKELAGAERGVPYAVQAADDAARRFAAGEEHDAMVVAVELLVADDDRAIDLHERAARAAILTGSRWEPALAHAGEAITGMARRDGPRAAAHVAVALGRMADRIETSRGWAFGRLVGDYRPSLDETGLEAVQLLAWEVEEAEFLDPDNPGIAVDSPDRRYMNTLAEQLEPRDRPTAYLYPTAAAVLADYRAGHRALATRLAFMGPGLYREAVQTLRPIADRLVATGQIGRALFLLGILGRTQVALGELAAAAATQRLGEEVLPRVEPESNVAFQFFGVEVARLGLVANDPRAVMDAIPDADFWGRTRPDTRWAAAATRIGRACLMAKAGDHAEAMTVLTTNLAAVERGALGAFNSVVTVSAAAEILWWAERADHAAVIEANLHTKILQPDFCEPDTDARWTAARLCALTGRPDEARAWFERARQRITANEAIVLIPHVCCDEALMEIRLGPRGDRVNGLRQLDEARRWIDRIGLPLLLPRVDRLTGDVRSLTD
jgi:class 3 adenylate cyclase